MEPKVSVEPVPFPAKQGKYREYLRHAPETGRRIPSNPLIILPFQLEFPKQRNREICRWKREIQRRNRELIDPAGRPLRAICRFDSGHRCTQRGAGEFVTLLLPAHHFDCKSMRLSWMVYQWGAHPFRQGSHSAESGRMRVAVKPP